MYQIIDAKDNTNVHLEFLSRVLENESILLNIFNFLSLKSFKQCRLVCQKWKSVSEHYFKSRVRICFDFGDGTEEDNKFSISNYPAPENLCDFFKASQGEFSFVAIRLSYDVIWSPETLKQFFATEGKFLTDVILYRVNLRNDGKKNVDKLIETYDLMSLFRDIDNLKSLKVQTIPDNPSDMLTQCTNTEFTLTLLDLYNIPEIYLSGCEIELTNHKLFPIKLDLRYIVFTLNEKLVSSVVLNDFVDFKVMKELSIANNYDDTNIKLDLSGKVNLVKLSLNRVTILNFEKSRCKVDTLLLQKIPFVQNSTIKIKNLAVLNCIINLNCIPQSCVNISISSTFQFSNIRSLANVKCLELCGSNTVKSCFPFLTTIFNSLTELKLFSHETVIDIDTSLIPQSVKKLELRYYFRFIGKQVKVLDTLTLKGSTLRFAQTAVNYFLPERFIIFVEHLQAKDCHCFLMTATKRLTPKIVFGLFDWKNSCHNPNSILSFINSKNEIPKVETPEEFFAFVNRRGDVIACAEYKIVFEMAALQ